MPVDRLAKIVTAVWLTAAVVSFSGCASAQDISLGKTQYQSSCAPCHGIDAKGDGPVGKELKKSPADLTVLAKNNNGVFPYDTVYQMIDGRNSTISSHGTREMPAWGFRFGPPQAFRFEESYLGGDRLPEKHPGKVSRYMPCPLRAGYGYPGKVPNEPKPQALRHVSLGQFLGRNGISSCQGRGSQ